MKKKLIPDGEYYIADDPNLRVVIVNSRLDRIYCLDGRDPHEAFDAAFARLLAKRGLQS